MSSASGFILHLLKRTEYNFFGEFLVLHQSYGSTNFSRQGLGRIFMGIGHTELLQPTF
jgi:hypothetical protein